MNEPARPVARLENVTQRYARAAALDAVTLEFPAGCMVGLIGPDGVGKSTLLSIIAGARQIQSGRVFVLDGDMADAAHRDAICPRIAYMPQGLGKNLYPDLSVDENIEFFGRLFGQSRAEREWRIAELLGSTGLAPFADRQAKKLSGGMRQKLGLCCSLIHDPDLLILDEPTTGVDPLSRRQFWELIDRIRSRRAGMSVVVATAYMEEAERFDWLIAMNDGQILATGSPATSRCKPGSKSVEDAFVALLPQEQRAGHKKLEIPPRRIIGAEPVIIAQRSHLPFRRFHRRRSRQLHDRARRNLRIRRLERLRQDHDHEDADRLAAAERRRSAVVRQAARRARHRRAQPRRLYVAIILALYRADGAAEPRRCMRGSFIFRPTRQRRALPN